MLLNFANRYIQNNVILRTKIMQDCMAMYLYSKSIFKINGNDKHQIKGSFYTYREEVK